MRNSGLCSQISGVCGLLVIFIGQVLLADCSVDIGFANGTF